MVSLSNLTMQYGGRTLFKNASLQLLARNHYGLVGPNGAGKSTLLQIITGDVVPDKGQIAIPSRITIGSLKQDHYIYDNFAIRDVVIMGKTRLWQALQKKEALLQKPEFTDEDCNELADYEKIIEELHGYSADSAAAQILNGLGLPYGVHEKPMHTLSGGHKLRVLLAQLLFSEPDVMLLDEPTNHLDIFSIRWLEEYLSKFGGTILLSSHDRHFLNAVCTHIVDIDYGVITAYVGNYDAFEQIKSQSNELREAQMEKQEKRKDGMMNFVERFGAKASKASQAQSRMKMVEKLEAEMETLQQQPSSRKFPKLSFDLCRQPGAIILKSQDIQKSYGNKKVLHNVSVEIERGERVAFVGANGIGKSTFLEIITGNQQANHGDFSWGFEAHCAYFPQDHAREVSGKTSLLDWLGNFDSRANRETLQKILARSLFSGDDVLKPVSVLSGGETARLILAKMMLVKHNILIFDEPTNHLDMESIESLIEALESYTGTILFVSHNRYFVEKLAKRVIEITPEGLKDYKCTYGEYLEKEAIDHLDVTKAMRSASDSQLSKGSDNNKPANDDQKKQQRQKDQLQRKINELEKKCQTIEDSLKLLNETIFSENFYAKIVKAEQEKTLNDKQRLEEKLKVHLTEWEQASEALSST